MGGVRMKKINLLGIALILGISSVNAQQYNLDSLYQCLDKAIANSSVYKAQREERIQSLREQLSKTADKEKQLQLTHDIFKAFKPYKNDSSLFYIDKCITLAKELEKPSEECLYRAEMALQYSNTGLYNEAFDILKDADKLSLDSLALGEYYHALNHVYGELGYYTVLPEKRKEYTMLAAQYASKMSNLLADNYDAALQRLEINSRANGKLEEALHYNDLRMEKITPNQAEFATVAYYRYTDFNEAKKLKEAEYWLTRSAICDVEQAVMDQGSMFELALNRKRDGDLDRAFRYIGFAWDCSDFFGTRVRNWQITPVLSQISKQYEASIIEDNQNLWWYTIISSILGVALVLTLWYVNQLRRRSQEDKD